MLLLLPIYILASFSFIVTLTNTLVPFKVGICQHGFTLPSTLSNGHLSLDSPPADFFEVYLTHNDWPPLSADHTLILSGTPTAPIQSASHYTLLLGIAAILMISIASAGLVLTCVPPSPVIIDSTNHTPVIAPTFLIDLGMVSTCNTASTEPVSPETSSAIFTHVSNKFEVVDGSISMPPPPTPLSNHNCSLPIPSLWEHDDENVFPVSEWDDVFEGSIELSPLVHLPLGESMEVPTLPSTLALCIKRDWASTKVDCTVFSEEARPSSSPLSHSQRFSSVQQLTSYGQRIVAPTLIYQMQFSASDCITTSAACIPPSHRLQKVSPIRKFIPYNQRNFTLIYPTRFSALDCIAMTGIPPFHPQKVPPIQQLTPYGQRIIAPNLNYYTRFSASGYIITTSGICIPFNRLSPNAIMILCMKLAFGGINGNIPDYI